MANSFPKHIILGISGGIAAYKSLFLIRTFKKAGCEVKVVATRNALEFITPLSVESLSQNPLYSDTFSKQEKHNIQHIAYADWGDCLVLAPATANIIGKMANGIADDALSTLLLAFNKPIFMAPAMNTNMYQNSSVQKNIRTLQEQGVYFITPCYGELACGIEGEGKMEEPENIFKFVITTLSKEQAFAGKKVLITAGPTYEPIDPVRFIGNYSSGLMGFALAEVFAEQGAEVELITGPTHLRIFHPAISRTDVETAAEMYEAVNDSFSKADVIIMAAAVADYTPVETAPEKIKKSSSEFSLSLKKTVDILADIGKRKSEKQFLTGFALETENELQNAFQKLKNKNLDLIVLNSLKMDGAGFKTPTNAVTMITKEGTIIDGALKSKKEVAKDISNVIFHSISLMS